MATCLEILFVVTAFLFQIILITHFALRKWRFEMAIRYGWVVYLLSIPAATVSIVLLSNIPPACQPEEYLIHSMAAFNFFAK